MAALTSTRSVSRFSTDTTLVRDVSEDMVLREPNANPLFVLTNASKRKRPSDTPKFEWIEDQEVILWGQASNGTTDYSSAATNVFVADVTIFAAGDLAAVPKVNSSASSEEVILVTATSGTTNGTITVTRGIGGAGADTIGATATIRILASALTEDAGVPTQRYQAKTPKASYCQIFRTPVKITYTAASTKQYAAPQGERKYQLIKGLIRHRSEIEAAGLWGRASETLAEPGSRWTSMGLKPIISTNKTDASTTLTLISFNTFSETAFRFGEKQKLFVAAPKVLSALNYFSQNKLLTHVEDKVFGVQLNRFVMPLGEFLLSNDYRMEIGITGGTNGGYNDEAYSIDLPSVEMRYLSGGEGLIGDTKLFEDVVKDGTTIRADEYRSQVGWAFRHEIKHALLYDVSSYS